MRARYYNVDIKRFINQDVLIGTLERISSLNRYAYVEGNPVSFLDPFGLDKWIYEEAHRWATHISYWISIVSAFLGPEAGLLLGTVALGFNLGVWIAEMVHYGFSAELIYEAIDDMWRSAIFYVLNIFNVSDAVRTYESLAGMVEAAYEEDKMHYPEMYDN